MFFVCFASFRFVSCVASGRDELVKTPGRAMRRQSSTLSRQSSSLRRQSSSLRRLSSAEIDTDAAMVKKEKDDAEEENLPKPSR